MRPIQPSYLLIDFNEVQKYRSQDTKGFGRDQSESENLNDVYVVQYPIDYSEVQDFWTPSSRYVVRNVPPFTLVRRRLGRGQGTFTFPVRVGTDV